MTNQLWVSFKTTIVWMDYVYRNALEAGYYLAEW
jgi:hypothetical protein